MEDNRVQNAAKTGSGRRNTDSEGAFGCEVAGDDRHRCDEEPTGTYSHTQSLREHELPILVTQTDHHKPEDDHEASYPDKLASVASIEERAGEDRAAAEEESFDAADPGNVRVRPERDQRRGVIVLPDAKGIDQTPFNHRISMS